MLSMAMPPERGDSSKVLWHSERLDALCGLGPFLTRLNGIRIQHKSLVVTWKNRGVDKIAFCIDIES